MRDRENESKKRRNSKRRVSINGGTQNAAFRGEKQRVNVLNEIPKSPNPA